MRVFLLPISGHPGLHALWACHPSRVFMGRLGGEGAMLMQVCVCVCVWMHVCSSSGAMESCECLQACLLLNPQLPFLPCESRHQGKAHHVDVVCGHAAKEICMCVLYGSFQGTGRHPVEVGEACLQACKAPKPITPIPCPSTWCFVNCFCCQVHMDIEVEQDRAYNGAGVGRGGAPCSGCQSCAVAC